MQPEFAYALADAQTDTRRPVRRFAASLLTVLQIRNYGYRRGSVDFPVSQGSAFDDLRRGRKVVPRRGKSQTRAEPIPITDENADEFIQNALIQLKGWVQKPLSVLLAEYQKQQEANKRK